MARQRSFLIGLIALAVAVGAIGGKALAVPTVSAGSIADQVSLMEHRFFFHQYGHDPVEKRLERLELLIFGTTQVGTQDERLARLKKTIADRDKKSVEQTRTGKTESPAGSPPKSSSTQYPILNTLEWRALKKTFPQESLDQRLARMETKLFGQPSPAMSYADRVERLNRILGVGASRQLPPGTVGPMPKANPRSESFGRGLIVPPGQLPQISPDGSDFSSRVAEIFKQMDRQMEQMMKMTPGLDREWIYPEGTPRRQSPVEPFIPEWTPAPPHSAPQLPPYYDPNSI